MLDINYFAFVIAAFVPMLIGFIWYGPLFGKTWMLQMGFTKETLAGTNMIKVLLICYVLSFLIAFALMPMTVHQMGMYSTLAGEPDFTNQASATYLYYEDFMSNYGDRFRTFKHGAFHGIIYGFFLSMPILTIQALFEKKSLKYILINAGYWLLTLAIMAGIVCKWV